MGSGDSKAPQRKVLQPTPVQGMLKPQPAPVNGILKPLAQPVDMKDNKFQVKLSGQWEDYKAEEDGILKRAYLVGKPNCRFNLRGQQYEYDFARMAQLNQNTGKQREIRPPHAMKAPPKPLLPSGPMAVIKVQPGQAGKMIQINDPNNPGQTLKVNVPKGAQAGQKMAVPVPEHGESLQDVQRKQKSHSACAKLLMGTATVAAVGTLAVGGVILGDHLSGGAVAEGVGDVFGDGAGDAVADATAWVEGAVEDFPEWIEGVGEDIAGAAEDAVDWLGDAAEDVGDFITDLF